MTMNMLVLHSGVYGHTHKVCQHMRPALEAAGFVTDFQALPGEVPDPDGFDAVLIGASIRNGKHNPAVLAFIERHATLLASKPSAFFSVNLVARKPHKNTPETNPYVKAFLAASPWQPDRVGVFGGELNYQRYSRSDRAVIRFIMWMNKGPTALDTQTDFTNWEAASAFATDFAEYAAGRLG
ncbi:MAG: menaquinone-dependent protoporphyrinogen IX dehydrogenase [Wenzhouxiangella sp.]